MRIKENSKEIVAIRGAIQIGDDNSEEIKKGTLALINRVLKENFINVNDVISCLFTMTSDLVSDLPPLILNEAGICIPSLCTSEHQTKYFIPKVIRVLVFVQWSKLEKDPKHIYFPGVSSSRPVLI